MNDFQVERDEHRGGPLDARELLVEGGSLALQFFSRSRGDAQEREGFG